MARPKKQLGESDYPLIASLASTGHREVDIARRLGISTDCWRRLRVEDERAAEAWETGRGQEHQQLYGKLFHLAMDGNVIALLFLLKTRFGYREGEPLEAAQSRIKLTLELPAALPLEQYTKLVNPLPQIESDADGGERD
jgi:hypothetical protein